MDVTEQLREELATFAAHQDALLADSLRKYVLIHRDQVVGTYDTETDAVSEGYRRFGNVPFLVKFITPVEEPANFVSPVIGF